MGGGVGRAEEVKRIMTREILQKRSPDAITEISLGHGEINYEIYIIQGDLRESDLIGSGEHVIAQIFV